MDFIPVTWMHIEEITMKMIFRAYDNTEFETFNDCLRYEVSSLGVVFLDEDFRQTDDYEQTYFIYAPNVKTAQMLIDYADTNEIDITMWKFNNDIEYFKDDEEVLFHWDESSQMYEAYPYSEITKLMEAINECKKNGCKDNG